MATVGLLNEGFVPALLPDIRAGMEEDARDTWSRSMPLGDRTLIGFFIGAVSERLALLWEIAELSFTMMDPDKATGAYLEALCLLTTTFRAVAEASVVMLTLCGNDGSIVAAGNIVSTASTGKNWDTFSDVTITALAAWTTSHGYTKGARVTNASRCYQCTTTGVSNGSGPGPTSGDPTVDITDGSAHWTYLGEGTAAVDVVGVSEDKGAVVGVARDITVIGTPVGGWNTCTNLFDAKLGRDLMADQELRLFREEELADPGTGTPDALRARLLKVPGVTHVTVFNNTTDLIDDGTITGYIGLPPHSCAVLIQGGNDQTIWDTIWQNKPLGCGTIGDQVGTSVDSEGVNQVVSFSRPTPINVYVYVVLEKLAKSYAGDDAVKLAIATFGANVSAGDDVVASALGAQAFDTLGVKKIDEVRVYTDVIAAGAAWVLGTGYVATPGSPSVVTNDARSYVCVTSGTSDDGTPGHTGPYGIGLNIVDNTVRWRFLGADIPVTSLQLAVYDTSRIIIVSSDYIP